MQSKGALFSSPVTVDWPLRNLPATFSFLFSRGAFKRSRLLFVVVTQKKTEDAATAAEPAGA